MSTTKKIAILTVVLGIATIAILSVSTKFKVQYQKELGLTPKESWVGQYLSGYHAVKNKDYDKASSFFSESLATDTSSNPQLQSRAMLLLLVSGKFSEAFQIAEELNTDDESSIAGLTLVVAEVEKDNFTKANNILVNLAKHEQNSIIHQILHAWVKLGMGNKMSALSTMARIQKEQKIEPLVSYHYALIAELAGNKELANKLHQQILKSESLPNPVAAAAWHFYQDQENPQKTLELIESKVNDIEAVKNYPDINTAKDGIAQAFLGIASIIMTEYRSDKAAAFFRLALYLDPNMNEAKMLLGSILIGEGDYKSANEILLKIDKDSNLSDYAKLAIARNFESLGQDAKAKQYFEGLMNSETTKIEALVSLGDIKRKEKDFASAIDYYNKAIDEIEKDGEDKIEKKYWAVYFAKGVAHERNKQWQQAEVDMQKALKLQPNQPDVLNYLAYTWIDMNIKLEEAKDMVELAFQQRPEDAHIIDSVGWSWFKLGDFDKAVKYLEVAATQMPYDPTVNDHLGDVYWMLGRETEAKFQWQRALDNDPEERFIESIKAKLANGIVEVAGDEQP